MSKERNDKESNIFLTPKPNQSFFFVYSIQWKETFFFSLQKKSFLRKRASGGLNKKQEGFLTALASPIKKDPTLSIRKHANELKIHEKTVWTAIKQDLSPDLKLLIIRKQNKCNFQSKYWFA